MLKEKYTQLFFGIAACSWMPHWSCHYYRLETGSSFIAGTWEFSSIDSLLSMLLYSLLIFLNLISISWIKPRFISALSSGILHLTLGIIHISRLINPFRFEVFGYPWSMASSLLEIFIIVPFGIICLVMALVFYKNRTIKH